MNKKNNDTQEPFPRIIEIEEQEIEEKKPPFTNIAYYKIVNENNDSYLEKKKVKKQQISD